MRITIPLVIEMSDEQVEHYAEGYDLPRNDAGNVYAKDVVTDVRRNVLSGVQGLLDADVSIKGR